MSTASSTPLGRALAAAIAQVRATVGDPVAPVVVLTPSEANAILARQQLALAGDFVRVELMTPERLIRELGRGPLAVRGLRPQPRGWLSATVAAVVGELADRGGLGRHAQTLAQPGWNRALVRAVESLEAAGITSEALATVHVPSHPERLRILVAVLDEVAKRREVDRLYSVGALCEAALPRVADGRFAGAVVLGDRLLAPRMFEALKAWLAAHPHLEVRPAPWHNLHPATTGLRQAVCGPTLDVLPEGDDRLAHIKRRLFTAPDAEANAPSDTLDGSVVLARTPDEVRDLAEATRVVLDAVDEGVPLDRIAVVLPDVAQAEVLRGHLLQAGVPATWLTGPPLATTPAARFLLHCLELANGDDTVPAWFELLRQPGLRLRAAIDEQVTQGRGRWRKVLARSGAVRQTSTIVAAVREWAEGVDEHAFDPEGDRRSAHNLARAIEALEAVFGGLRSCVTLGEHARRFSSLLRSWWMPSADRARVLALLSSWGSPGIGLPLTFAAVIGELRDALQSTPALQGSLLDPAIRIVSPMGLLGGSFELVVATGMTEGRLPRRPDEDPLLPDALLHAINRTLGVALIDSRDLAQFEARRFAAIVGAANRRLWLFPATELLEDRPLLPGSFMLDVASVLLGRRARYRDLNDRLMRRFGSRARPWPEDPATAISELEHRVARTATERGAGLRTLVADPVGRRLVGLHRALDATEPTPWTGRIDPTIVAVPGLDGEPLPAKTLAKLLGNPAAFLVDEVLGVRRPSRLYASSDPTGPAAQRRLLLQALEPLLDEGTPSAEAFVTQWDVGATQWRRHRADVDDDTVGLMRALAVHRFEQLLAVGALPCGPRARLEGKPVAELPWMVEAHTGRVDAGTLADLRKTTPARGKLARDVPELLLGAMVDGSIDTIEVASLEGKRARGSVTAEAAAMSDDLGKVTRCVEAGWWPWRASDPDLTLRAEALLDYADDDVIDAVLGRHR